MNNTVLTDEQKDKFVSEICEYGTGFVAPLYSVVEAIEQAVLKSAQVQTWKRDADRWQFFISNYDEYGTVPYIDGENLRADVDAAMEKQP